MKSYGVTIQMKATEQYFPVVLFIMLYKVVLTILYVNEILWCDHSNESYWAVLSCDTDYYALQSVWFQILILWMKSWCVTIQKKLDGSCLSSSTNVFLGSPWE